MGSRDSSELAWGERFLEDGELRSTGVGDFSQVPGLPLPLLQEAVFLADSR